MIEVRSLGASSEIRGESLAQLMCAACFDIRNDRVVVVSDDFEVLCGRGEQADIFDLLVVFIDAAIALIVDEENGRALFPEMRLSQIIFNGLVKRDHGEYEPLSRGRLVVLFADIETGCL